MSLFRVIQNGLLARDERVARGAGPPLTLTQIADWAATFRQVVTRQTDHCLALLNSRSHSVVFFYCRDVRQQRDTRHACHARYSPLLRLTATRPCRSVPRCAAAVPGSPATAAAQVGPPPPDARPLVLLRARKARTTRSTPPATPPTSYTRPSTAS